MIVKANILVKIDMIQKKVILLKELKEYDIDYQGK